MSKPYTTDEAIRAALGPARVLVLLDRDEDADEDVGVADTGNVAPVDDAISWADDAIDASQGVKYVVPFASLTSTPAQVQRLSTTGAIAYLYEWLDPRGKDAELWRKRFDEGCEAYRTGKWVIVGATLLASDSAANARAVLTESGGLTYSGRVDDDYTDSGSDRFGG